MPAPARKTVHELAEPFPQKYVHDDGKGNAYVPHHIVTQRLIHIFGVPPKVEVLREIYDETNGEKKLTGVVMRLTVPGFDPVEEAGEADNPQAKTNGARLKSATSDAIKRCAMRLGLGLHLWAQKEYFLYDRLQEGGVAGSASVSTPPNKADGSASSESSEAGTDNEGTASSSLGGSDSFEQKPAPASGNDGESGGKQQTEAASEPQGDGAARTTSPSLFPATDLVEVYGTSKVLLTARKVAKANALEQPLSVEQINDGLAALVGKQLENA